MDLSTTYLGFRLPHPIIPGASPLAGDLDAVKRLEDAGAPMITLHSLFEEQINGEALAMAAAAKQKEFKNGNHDVARDLMPFLKEWLTEHIQGTDRLTGQHLAKQIEGSEISA